MQTFAPTKKQGAFDALISESDSDEDVEEKVQEDFPAIGNAPTKVAPVTTGWASVAAAAPKPAPIKAKMPEPVAPTKVQQDNSAWSDDEDEKEDFWAKQQAKSAKYAGKSWADSDWDDSSDEEDDDW